MVLGVVYGLSYMLADRAEAVFASIRRPVETGVMAGKDDTGCEVRLGCLAGDQGNRRR